MLLTDGRTIARLNARDRNKRAVLTFLCDGHLRFGAGRKKFQTTPQEGTRIMGLFSKDIKKMDDLFVHTLRDIY